MTRRTPLPYLLVALAGLGCATSEPIAFPDPSGEAGTSGAGAAGTSGVAGTSGAGTTGSTGLAGTTGTTGAAGTSAARGGTTGTAGTFGRGGTTGTAGTFGRGGTTGTAGTTGRGGTTGTACASGGSAGAGTATFTQVYSQVISTNCAGSACHIPATGGRPNFATQSNAYSYFKNQGQLYGGMDPQKSYIYFVMHGDPAASPPSPPYMPPDPNPKVSATNLATVAAWICAGALNN